MWSCESGVNFGFTLNPNPLSLYMHIYIYVYTYTYIYIYKYIFTSDYVAVRERGAARAAFGLEAAASSVFASVLARPFLAGATFSTEFSSSPSASAASSSSP